MDYVANSIDPGFIMYASVIKLVSSGFEYILCTISLAISYVLLLFCAHLCALLINFNCNDENWILVK